MNYEAWESSLPETITADSLWKMTAYRLALFLADVSWHDVTKLIQDRRAIGLADQLYRSVGSISANLAEGYSRGTGKDRARFYEYALGSARENRDWYFKGRHILGELLINIVCNSWQRLFAYCLRWFLNNKAIFCAKKVIYIKSEPTMTKYTFLLM